MLDGNVIANKLGSPKGFGTLTTVDSSFSNKPHTISYHTCDDCHTKRQMNVPNLYAPSGVERTSPTSDGTSTNFRFRELGVEAAASGDDSGNIGGSSIAKKRSTSRNSFGPSMLPLE